MCPAQRVSKIEKVRIDSLRVPVVGKAQRPFHEAKADEIWVLLRTVCTRPSSSTLYAPRSGCGSTVEMSIIPVSSCTLTWLRAHSRFPGHALTPTGVMAIRCKQFHLPDL